MVKQAGVKFDNMIHIKVVKSPFSKKKKKKSRKITNVNPQKKKGQNFTF